MVALALLVATLSLMALFVGRDFEVAYVALHSDLAMEPHLTWVAFYAGNEGSLLYIAMALGAMAALAVWRAPHNVRDTLPYTTGVLMLVMTFFLAVMGFMANPFDKLPFIPLDGEGINPLLTHFGMFIHPPALMAGLIAASIPFAFGHGVVDWRPSERRMGGRGPGLGHSLLGVAGLWSAGGFLVGLYDPWVGRVLVLGPGGERGPDAVALD